MPLVVLTADESLGELLEAQAAEGELPDGVPADFGYVIDSSHAEAQNRVARIVSGSRHLTETESESESGHNMMIDNAPIVTEAILEVIDSVRAEGKAVAG